MDLTCHNYCSSSKRVCRVVLKGIPGRGRELLFGVLMACSSLHCLSGTSVVPFG